MTLMYPRTLGSHWCVKMLPLEEVHGSCLTEGQADSLSPRSHSPQGMCTSSGRVARFPHRVPLELHFPLFLSCQACVVRHLFIKCANDATPPHPLVNEH